MVECDAFLTYYMNQNIDMKNSIFEESLNYQNKKCKKQKTFLKNIFLKLSLEMLVIW